MRFSPSIVPPGDDRRDVYLVLDDFGRLGRAWREADEHDTDRETVIVDMLGGQYANPVRVVAFNVEDGTSRDASAEIIEEILERRGATPEGVPESLTDFVDRHGGWRQRPLQLSLPIAIAS